MRLRFLLKRRGQDGSQLPPLGRVFFVDPLKTPTVASVADFIRSKCNVETEVNFYLDGYLVDPTDSVAVFDHDDVITVCSKDFPETPGLQDNRADVTQTSAAGGLHENSNVMRSILKKRKTVSICAVRPEDEGDEPSFANPNVSMLVNLPATPPADISFPNISNKKRKLDDVESDESSEEESSDDEPAKRAKKPVVVEEESSEEESTDDEPPKPPVGKKRIPVKVSSEEESSDEELPKPPAGLLKKPSVESEESESEEEEEEDEKSAELETSTAVAGGSDVSSQALAQKKKRKRKRGSRGKKKAPEEQKKAAPTPKNDTINLSSDVSRSGDTRLPKDEWDKLRRNKRLATVKFVPASFNNRNKHVRFEPDRPEGGDDSEKKVAGEVEKMDVSVASNGGGFGGNGSFSAGRFSDTSGDLSKRFPTPGGFPTRTPSASSTPLRLMPRQIRMPRISVGPGWSISKNSPQQPSPLAATTTPSSSPVVAAGSRTMSLPAVVKSPLDSALKTVHLNESQTNKSRVYRSPLATVDNKSTDELNDKDLKEPFDMGSEEETEEPSIVEMKQNLTTNGGEGKKKYEEYPTLRPKQPKKGDKIAFKILEMSVDMCPEISDYKEGVVLDYNPSADAISFEVTVEPKPQTEDEENVGASLQNGVGIEIIDTKWANVIDPRLMA